MELKKSANRLGLIASALTLIQGVVWLILCIIAIIKRYGPVPLPTLSFGDQLSFQLYLNLRDDISFGGALTGHALMIMLYIYLFLSTTWICAAIILIMNVRKPTTSSKTKACYFSLGVWTIFICCFDVVLVGAAGDSYAQALDLYEFTLSINPFLPLSYGILMCLAARGFVLWVINLILGVMLIKQASNFSKKNKIIDDVPNMVLAFDDGRNFPQEGLVNNGYNWDDDTGSAYNDHIQPPQTPQHFGSLQNHPKILPKPRLIENVAKLGKAGQRSYLHNVAPPKPPNNYIYPSQSHPIIPHPDYSPPNTPLQPQLKSVLKNQLPQNPFTFNRNNMANRY